MASSDTQRPLGLLILVILGWIILFLLYCTQAVLLVSFLAIHNHPQFGWYCLLFIPAILFTFTFLRRNWNYNKYANNEKEIKYVWFIWLLYITAYVITVATIFSTIANDLTKKHTLGVNALKITLCITPGLLILFLQLAISPSYRNSVLYLSMFAALNIFDGIEMLETFLMQNEEVVSLDSATEGLKKFLIQHDGHFNFSNGTEMLKDFLMENSKHFDLNSVTEVFIVVFVSICFLLTSFALARSKFVSESTSEVKEKTRTSIIFSLLEIIFTDLPFLVIRGVIWRVHKYEAAVFIAKNIVSLVVGIVECGILIKKMLDKEPRVRPQTMTIE